MKKTLFLILLTVLHFTTNAQTIIYVDGDATGVIHDGTTWATAYTNLSDAFTQFNAAATTTQYEVRIAKGTYYPSVNDRVSTFGIFRGGVKLLGAYQAGTNIRDTALYRTVLSGDIGVQGSNFDNSYHVMVVAGIPATADSIVIDRIRIINGNANGFASSIYNGVSVTQNKGGGIYCRNSHPVISNCTFLNNIAAEVTANGSGGGGGAIFNANANPVLANCNFAGNTATNTHGGAVYDSVSNPAILNCKFAGNYSDLGGALYNFNCNPTVTNCNFSGNSSYNSGGAMHNVSSSPTITNCSFSGNITGNNTEGAAIHNYLFSSPVITSCSFSGNMSSFGAGVSNHQDCSTIITDCSFSNNTGGIGGGIYNYYSNITVTNCSFSDNTVSSTGGAIDNDGSDPTITNCRFVNNHANVTGGGMDNDFSDPVITNCVFIGNTAWQPFDCYGGGMYNNHSAPIITNTVFSGNSSLYGGGIYNNSSTPKLTNTTIFNNLPSGLDGLSSSVTLQNSIVWDTVIGTGYIVASSMIKGQPPYAAVTSNQVFKNTADLIGADSIWSTADDGLQLLPCALAVNAGDNDSIPAGITTDITGSPRIQFVVVDMGAYESNSMWSPGATVITNHTISAYAPVVTGNTTYFTMMCDTLLAAVHSDTGSNAIKGNTHAKVWIDTVADSTFAARHYQIIPDSNANNAIGFVTLYFLQSEFDAYNAVNVIKLPAYAADTAGIANLKILERGGMSSDGSGLPGTYPGPQTVLDPEDSNIVWNNTANRWEVSFAVAGFGGFFVQAEVPIPLAIPLEHFSGYRAQQANYLNWKLKDEQSIEKYELQRSADARKFVTIATIVNTAQGRYSYIDKDIYHEGMRYYRLKLAGYKGSTYSHTIALAAGNSNGNFTLYPNPAEKDITIFAGKHTLLPIKATIYDIVGKAITSITLTEHKQLLDISGLPNGMYFIQVGNGAMSRFVKQ